MKFIETTTVQGVTVIGFIVRSLSNDQFEEFKSEFFTTVDDVGKGAVVDFETVEHLTSAEFGVLMISAFKLMQKGLPVMFCNLKGWMRDTLMRFGSQKLKFDNLSLQFCDTTKEALSSMLGDGTSDDNPAPSED